MDSRHRRKATAICRWLADRPIWAWTQEFRHLVYFVLLKVVKFELWILKLLLGRTKTSRDINRRVSREILINNFAIISETTGSGVNWGI